MTISDDSRKAARRWRGVDPERSRVMSLVRSKDTGPEMRVRRLIHGMGYRYSLHRRDLPGKPDLVLVARRKVIFVHGCYWHAHRSDSCRRARLPKTRIEFWREKFARNAERDVANTKALIALGWAVLTIWECETSARHNDVLAGTLRGFIECKSIPLAAQV